LRADQHIKGLKQRHPFLKLDEFVVMPNHIHLILIFREVKGIELSPLAKVIGWLKAGITRDYRKEVRPDSQDIWGRDFYDHVIRTEEALYRIREYIQNIVLKWSLDRDNPDRTGVDPFYYWWRDEISRQKGPLGRFRPAE
jgi:REP element-mobilizing transposase RayT